MSFYLLLWYYLWIAPHALQVVVLFLIFRRGLLRQYPLFFSYTVSEIFQFCVLFAVYHQNLTLEGAYSRIYSVGLVVSAVLRFGVIYEICLYLFRNYPMLARPGRPLLRAAAVVLLLVSLGLAVATSVQAGDYVRGTQLLDRSVSIFQCGILVLLFVVSRYFGLSWRSQVFGIAMGVGIFASVELAASAFRTQVGPAQAWYLDYVTLGTYHACVLTWIYYLWVEERGTSYAVQPPPPGGELDEWSEELQRLLR